MGFALAVLASLGIFLLAIVATYLVARSDEAEIGVINSVLRLVDSTTKSVVSILESLVSIGVALGPYASLLWRPMLVLLVAVAMHEGYHYVLEYGDVCWRCVLYPFITMFLRSVLHVIRFLYDTFVPLYNYGYLLSHQLFRGSAIIFAKCDVQQFIHVMKLTLRSGLLFFQSLFTWTGGGSISQSNNLLVNEWDIRAAMLSFQETVQESLPLVKCSCSGLNPVWDMAFYLLRPETLSVALYHGLNGGLSSLQEIIGAAQSKYPRFRRTVYHINGALFHAGLYADDVVVHTVQRLIDLTGADFDFHGLPEEFVFTTGARLAMTATHFGYTIVRSGIHVFMPIPKYLESTDYMRHAMSFDEGFRQLDMVIENSANILTWGVKVVRGQITREKMYIPHRLDCEVRATYETGDPNALGCTLMHSAKAVAGVAYIATRLPVELLWTSTFNHEQDYMRVLQKYDGPTDRSVDTCEARKASGDMTIDTNRCQCQRAYGVYPPFDPQRWSSETYDPFCDQPTLQANVFNHLESAIKLSSRAFTSPAFAKITEGVGLLGLEVLRVPLRLALSGPDILESRFWSFPQNCGYGMTRPRLAVLGLARGDICSDRRAGFPECALGSASTACRCSYDFPDDEVTAAETPQGNSVEASVYASQANWCNTFFLEYIYVYIRQIASGVTDLVETIHPQGSSYCDGRAYQLGATDINNYGPEDWNSILGSFDPNSCKLPASDDILCGGTYTVEYFTKTVLSVVRQITHVAVSFMDGRTEVPFHLENRLCDVQRLASLTSGSLVSLIPGDENLSLRHSLSRLVFWTGDALIEAVRFGHNVMKLGQDVLQGRVALNEDVVYDFVIQQIDLVFDYLIEFLGAFGDFLDHVVQGAAQFFNSLVDIITFVRGLVKKKLINVVMTLTRLAFALLDVIVNGAPLPTDLLEELFTVVFDFTKELIRQPMRILEIVLKMMGPFGKVLETFVGSTCQVIEQTLCMITRSIEVIESFIPIGGGLFGEDMCDLGCASTQGDALESFQIPDFPELPFGGDFASLFGDISGLVSGIVGDVADVLGDVEEIKGVVDDIVNGAANVAEDVGDEISGWFSRRLHTQRRLREKYGGNKSQMMRLVPWITATHMNWTGTSECDQVVHAYKEYDWEEMRPLERVKVLECLQQRKKGILIGKLLKLPIPQDIFYNPRRRWTMLHDAGYALTFYLQQRYGGWTTDQMMSAFREHKLNPKLYLSALEHVFNWGSSVRVDALLRQSFGTPPVNSTLYHMFHTYDAVHQMSTGVSRMWSERNMTASLAAMMGQAISLPGGRRLYGALEAAKDEVVPVLRTAETLAAGVDTSIDGCQGEYVCLNCLILDNFLNVAITEGKHMFRYYETTYSRVILPDFIEYWNDQDQNRAWTEDMGGVMDRARAETLDDSDWSAQTMEALTLNARVYSAEVRPDVSMEEYFNTADEDLYYFSFVNTTREAQRRKDWEELLEFKLPEPFMQTLGKLFTTVDDSYVPFTGFGIPRMLKHIFTDECHMEKIYCTSSTAKAREERIRTFLMTAALMVLGSYVFGFVTGVQVGMPLALLAALFMLIVYDYTVRCIPSLPLCMMDDIYSFLHDYMFPACFCTLFPGLQDGCDIQTCHLCSAQTQWKTCSVEVNKLYDNVDVYGFGYGWAPLFYARYYLPDLVRWAFQKPPFGYVLQQSLELGRFVEPIINDPFHESTPLEWDCARLLVLDLAFPLLGAIVAVITLPRVMVFVGKVVASVGLFVANTFAVFYTMIVTIDKNTIR